MRSRTALFCLLVQFAAREAMAQDQGNVVRMFPQVSGVRASFRGIAVRGQNEAWVTGSQGTVIRTLDGGKTWHPIEVPNAAELDFRDIELLPDGTVVIMSIGSGALSRILRSRNAGRTWDTVLINDTPEGFFDGFAFDSDGKKGMLFGDPVDGKLDLYRTVDGAKTWTQLEPPLRPGFKEGEYGFAASGTSIALYGSHIWIGTGGTAARVWRSTDWGTTWRSYDTPIRCGTESSGIFSIAVIDKKNVVVVGGDYAKPNLDRGNVARSVDGGVTWSALPGVQMPHKACVQSLGSGRLLTCGRTGVAFSDDTGKTWTSLTTESYYTLDFDRASNIGFLAGADGRVARFEILPRF